MDNLFASGFFVFTCAFVIFAGRWKGAEGARKDAQEYRAWIHNHIAPEVLHKFCLVMVTLLMAAGLYSFFRQLISRIG